ncbi:MAG: cellulase family glycosylhydrolase [Victivallales bacterium]|nr:cellulase family glycosylhydrolase [Victivallales bacterium]
MNMRQAAHIFIVCLLLLCCAAAKERLVLSPYGVASHLFGWEADRAEEELRMMHHEGIDVLRGPAGWGMVMPSRGQWLFTAFDKLMEQCKQNQVAYIPLLHMPPSYMKPLHKHLPEWGDYVRRMAQRYGDRMYGFEVMNEPDLQGISAENYGKILLVASKELRQHAPNAKILFSGTSGIPYDYIEKVYRQPGVCEAFDIMCIHPYCWNDVPETRLPGSMRKLRALMAKYGIADKPVWLTEVGYSSQEKPDFLQKTLPRMLQEMKVKQENMTAVLLYDSDYCYYSETHTFRLDDYFPGVRRRFVSLEELNGLHAEADAVLFLPDTQCFPSRYNGALKAYLDAGGKVISPAGFPFYFDMIHDEKGNLDANVQINARDANKLHISWEASWLKKGVVAGKMDFSWADASIADEAPEPFFTYYFFNGDKLEAGEHFTPIVYAMRGEYKGVSAGVYHLKNGGMFGVGGVSWRGCTEADQARLLPRTYLCWLGAGADRICCHSYRSTEHKGAGVEGYFGLHRRNLERKSASYAYETLVRFMPVGSTRPVIGKNGDIYIAKWKNPKNEVVYGIWRGTIYGGECEFAIGNGRQPRSFNHLGVEVPLSVKQGRVNISIGPGIVYLTGAGDLSLIHNRKGSVEQ